MFVKETQL